MRSVRLAIAGKDGIPHDKARDGAAIVGGNVRTNKRFHVVGSPGDLKRADTWI